MAVVSEVTINHVPAWKKLGLKLKYAKEEPNEPVANSAEAPKRSGTGHKRKFTSEVNGEEVKREGRKKSKRSSPPTSEDIITNKPGKRNTSPHSPSSSSSPSKRKSVSFTPETKREDGDSAKQIYSRWVAAQKAHDPSFDPANVSPAFNSFLSTESESTSQVVSPPIPLATSGSNNASEVKKAKQKKRKKSKKTSANPDNSTSLAGKSSAQDQMRAALSYLHTYHTSPDTWKFSKPHQNRLIKHLFSLDHIPSSYDAALLSYIRGLASPATRARKREQALEIRTEDERTQVSKETMTPPGKISTVDERREQDYHVAVEHMRKMLEEKEDMREEYEEEIEWKERMEKRRRAEIVLWSLGSAESDQTPVTTAQAPPPSYNQYNPPTPIPAPHTNSTQTQPKKKRKRKRPAKDRRHAIPDDLTTSSSDSDLDPNTESARRKREILERNLQLKEERLHQREKLAQRRRELDRMKREVEESLSSGDSSDNSDDGGDDGGQGGQKEGKGKGKKEKESSKMVVD